MPNYQPKPRWTARQIHFLIENCYKMRDEDMAQSLGKSLKSVRRKRERMEMKKASGRGVVAAAYDPLFDEGPKPKPVSKLRQDTPSSPPIG